MKLIHVFKYFFFAIPSLLFPFITLAQSFQYQPYKPGNFIFDNHLGKCQDVDITAVQSKLTPKVNWVRRNNPVIDQPSDFGALAGFTGYYFDLNPKMTDWRITLENFTANYQLREWEF
jgi:hypothetical protein